MSLDGRARVLARRRVGSLFASTHENDAHNDDRHRHGLVDTNVYPENSFRAPVGRNVVLVSVLGGTMATFLPGDWLENKSILRAWTHHGYVKPELYRERNIKHLEQSVAWSEDQRILKHAETPKNRQWVYQGYTDSGCQLAQAEELYADARAHDKSKLSEYNDSNAARSVLVPVSSYFDGYQLFSIGQTQRVA